MSDPLVDALLKKIKSEGEPQHPPLDQNGNKRIVYEVIKDMLNKMPDIEATFSKRLDEYDD